LEKTVNKELVSRKLIDIKDMKRICLSAGLVALGAVAAHGQYAPGLSSMEATKPWSLSGTVRGFYDDNFLTLPKTIQGPTPGTFVQGSRSSFGVEASPSVAYNHSVEDTLLSASYVYDIRWYQNHIGSTDQTHQFNAKLDHEFSERYKLSASESFVIAQEPGILDSAVIATPLRVSGSNVRNTGTLDLMMEMSRLFDLHIGYGNTVYAYSQNAGDETTPNSTASYSALLDRMDQTAAVDLRWKALPQTTGVLGYQYEHVNYTSPEPLFPSTITANSRNTDNHFVYVGADDSFTPDLNASIRVGGEYVDYYNEDNHEISPYVDASVTYQYMPQSTVQIGVKHIHNATDVAGVGVVPGATKPVLDEESTAAYVSVSHRVTSRFTASALLQGQYSTFNGGAFNNQQENFYMATVDFTYHFTPWIAGETGYSYNKLNTDIAGRGYSRDIVYVGIRATY
jgi:hypothetical protein